jgi:hypothetical protein
MQMPEAVFSGTDSVLQNTYGYYVLGAGGIVLIAERFTGAPLPVGTPGASIAVVVQFTDRSEY